MWLSFNQKGTEDLRVDALGHGSYGKDRTHGEHHGVDLLALPDSIAFIPFKGIITKIGQVYSQTTEFKYVEFKGFGLMSVYTIRVFYLTQDYAYAIKVGDKLKKYAPLGLVQDVAAYHGEPMKNHIHIEARLLGKRVNPTPFIKFSKN